MKAKHKALAAQKPVVVRADLGTRGVVFRVRLAGFEESKCCEEKLLKTEIEWSFLLREQAQLLAAWLKYPAL